MGLSYTVSSEWTSTCSHCLVAAAADAGAAVPRVERAANFDTKDLRSSSPRDSELIDRLVCRHVGIDGANAAIDEDDAAKRIIEIFMAVAITVDVPLPECRVQL